MNKIATQFVYFVRKVFLGKDSARKKVKWLHEKFPQYEIGRGTYGDPHIRTWKENGVCPKVS